MSMLGLLAEYIMPPTSAPRNPIMRRTRTSFGGGPYKPSPKPTHFENEWTYLRQVVRGQCAVDQLSSLELNLIAVEILEAARRAARAPAPAGGIETP